MAWSRWKFKISSYWSVDEFKSKQYGTCFCRENGAVILNAMTIAMINEDCCYRNPLGVFRTVSVESYVSWEFISYCEVSVVVCDWRCDRLPRRGEFEYDAWLCVLPWRNLRRIVQGYIVQFDSQALKMGSHPKAKGSDGRRFWFLYPIHTTNRSEANRSEAKRTVLQNPHHSH